MMGIKVTKLEADMQQCMEALHEIKESLVVINIEQDHAILAVSKEKTKRSTGCNRLRNKALLPRFTPLDFPKILGENPTSWVHQAS